MSEPTFGLARCCNCDVLFYMTETLIARRKEDRGDFYCPNGHRQAFVKSTADRLREELDAANRTLATTREVRDRQSERAAKAEAQLARAKRALKKLSEPQ